MGTGVLLVGQATYELLLGRTLLLLLHLSGFGCFAHIVSKRLAPLLRAAPDPRFDRPFLRLQKFLQFWLAQWKQPRYWTAGVLHIVVFAGFLILLVRSFSLVLLAVTGGFLVPESSQSAGHLYSLVCSYAATLVFLSVVIAVVRRLVFKPARYAVPAQYGKSHMGEAILVLGLIATLMVTEGLFDATAVALQVHPGQALQLSTPLSLTWAFEKIVPLSSPSALRNIYLSSFVIHQLTFLVFLCFLPFGKHFHVLTSLFNVYFCKLDREALKPVRWDLQDLDQARSIGVKKFEDFTWKHILDFYSCADCGRCSDNCPANTVGRPLSPRFLTIKARDYSFRHYPVFGSCDGNGPIVGQLYSEDEIWSCTTCGACEEECPLLNEYIDKIVDLRRGLMDDGKVPQTLQKPLQALERRGNPYGKLEKKRADWAKAPDFQVRCEVKILNDHATADTLYFVDSITSYDDRMQSIGRATARILSRTGETFGILGAKEKDSGHEVRRFGEETLFTALRDQNAEAIRDARPLRIVTSDPHAYNALTHDYKDLPPVEHISQVIARQLRSGQLRLKPVENQQAVYTYHDPCYLGRHNHIYDDPREVLDAIPGLQRVEMERSRDRAFCCGGGGLNLFYEPKEEQRMGVVRVKMAERAGANVIVTACPYCMANLEDAIKVAGLEGKMSVIDLAELVEKHMIEDTQPIKQPAQKQTEAHIGAQAC
jgi:Fe-S oxidoreductase